MSIRRNATYNLGGSLIPVFVSLITLPVYLGVVGEARYGALAITWLLLGYFGIFNLGTGRATAQKMAAHRDSSPDVRARIFWTGISLNAVIGIVGGLLIWPAGTYFFGGPFKVDAAIRDEILIVMPLLMVAVPMATVSGVLQGALQGRERFFELNLISVTEAVLFQLLPLFTAIYWNVHLALLISVALIPRLLAMLVLMQRCHRHVYQGYYPSFSRDIGKELLRFGGWVTISSMVGPLMVILDRFVIGVVFGAKTVTSYTIPFQLSERSTVFSSSLANSLFPVLAASTEEEQVNLASNALRALIVILTPLVVLGILIFETFLQWWISPEFSIQAAEVGRIVLIGFWFNGLARISHTVLQSKGSPEIVAKCHVMEVLPYLALLYLCLTSIGITGAAIAFSLRTIVDFVLLSGFAKILRQSLAQLALPMVLLLLAYMIATTHWSTGNWVILATGHVLLTGIWAWWQAPQSVRDLVLAGVKSWRADVSD